MSFDRNFEQISNPKEVLEYGKPVVGIEGLKEVLEIAKKIDERLFVRLSDGRVVEIDKVELNPKEPIVCGVKYKDEEDDGEQIKMGLFEEFLSKSPVVFDQTKSWKNEEDV